jgi:Fur family ferric uptake transcriptional regulator
MTHADELKNSGLKATLPRIKVLEVFQTTTQRHLSAEDVYKLLLAEHADVGLATVYRVLMQFEQAGILSRTHFETGKAVFELNEGKHHDHLVCMDCGRVEEFYDAEIEKRQRSIAARLRAPGPRARAVRGLHQEELRLSAALASAAAPGGVSPPRA